MEFSTSQVARWTKHALPVLLGALGGYAYYLFIGCAGGECPITSSPWKSTAYGALMGAIFIFGNAKSKSTIKRSQSGE